MTNFSRIIYIGEVPPADQFKLLTEKFGMGPNLAEMCLAAYGGHTYFTTLGLSGLSIDKEDFTAESISPLASIYPAIEEYLDDPKVDRALLWRLALDGFAPLKKANDPSAEMLSEGNVAGFVTRQGKVIGLRTEMWGNCRSGLIPASRVVQLMILRVLLANKLEEFIAMPR